MGLLSIEQLRREGATDYTVGQLYRGMLQNGDCAKDVTIQSALGTSCDSMAWPLVPHTAYLAPPRSPSESSQETTACPSSRSSIIFSGCSAALPPVACATVPREMPLEAAMDKVSDKVVAELCTEPFTP